MFLILIEEINFHYYRRGIELRLWNEIERYRAASSGLVPSITSPSTENSPEGLLCLMRSNHINNNVNNYM